MYLPQGRALRSQPINQQLPYPKQSPLKCPCRSLEKTNEQTCKDPGKSRSSKLAVGCWDGEWCLGGRGSSLGSGQDTSPFPALVFLSVQRWIRKTPFQVTHSIWSGGAGSRLPIPICPVTLDSLLESHCASVPSSPMGLPGLFRGSSTQALSQT